MQYVCLIADLLETIMISGRRHEVDNRMKCVAGTSSRVRTDKLPCPI
jgi:hypothetical protein